MNKGLIYTRFATKAQLEESNPRRAVIYARSATAEQAVNSISIQVEACEEFARIRGYEVSGVYSDIGSGLSDQRTQLQRLIQDSSTQSFSAVIVQDVGRLTRDRNSFIKAKTLLQEKNIIVLSTTTSNFDHQINECFAKIWRASE